MAKTKPVSPKKGVKAAPSPVATRTSPRKATPSAKKSEAALTASPSRVTKIAKKQSPSKKASPAKKTATTTTSFSARGHSLARIAASFRNETGPLPKRSTQPEWSGQKSDETAISSTKGSRANQTLSAPTPPVKKPTPAQKPSPSKKTSPAKKVSTTKDASLSKNVFPAKKVSPGKKASPAKKALPAKRASPAKKSFPEENVASEKAIPNAARPRGRPKVVEKISIADAAQPTTATPATRPRGRPRKASPVKHTSSQSQLATPSKANEVKPSSMKRGKSPTQGAEIAHATDSWTDSPSKKAAKQPISSRNATPSRSSVSPDKVRPSIEDGGSTRRSPYRPQASKSLGRALQTRTSRSPSKTGGGAGSATKDTGSPAKSGARTRPRSPAKNVTSQNQRASPARDVSRGRSPGKSTAKVTTTASPVSTQEKSTRSRSASRTRGDSAARDAVDANGVRKSASTSGPRSASQSPARRSRQPSPGRSGVRKVSKSPSPQSREWGMAEWTTDGKPSPTPCPKPGGKSTGGVKSMKGPMWRSSKKPSPEAISARDSSSVLLQDARDPVVAQKARTASASPGRPMRQLKFRGYPRKSTNSADAKAAKRETPPNGPSAPGRGAFHSATNPYWIADYRNATGTKKMKNPFFETMPGPEVWHRRMPNRLPFGETPFMEQELSRQITEDLARDPDKQDDARKTGIFNGIVDGVRGLVRKVTGSNPEPEQPPVFRSIWELPEVDEEDVERVMAEMERIADRKHSVSAPTAGRKRKTSDETDGRRQRARSGQADGEALMSGALR